MTTTHGQFGVVRLGASVVAEVTNFTFESSVDVADDTAMGDTFKSHQPGMKEWSGTVDCFWDESDATGQATLDEGASVTLNLFPAGAATGKKYYSGTATMTRGSVAVKLDGIVTRSFTFLGNGGYTILTQA
jgi:hypothetical protein